MTNEKQTTLNWDEVENPAMLSVQDVREGDKVVPVRGTSGNIVDLVAMTFKNNEGEQQESTAYVLNCTLNGTQDRLRINKSALFALKSVRAGKDENLLSKEFKIQFKGEGKYRSIKLILSGTS